MFRGDAQHTGYFGDQKPIENPKTKWKFKTNGRIFSSPIIDDGIVYFGSADSCFYAVNEIDGQLKWKFKTDGEVKSSPAICNNMVYFMSFDGYFYALNADNGDLIWKFQTEGEKLFSKKGFNTYSGQMRHDPWDFFLSSPVTDGEIVYFGCGDGYLYALDAVTGNKIWSFKTGDVVHSSPTLYKGNIYFGSWDHYFLRTQRKNRRLDMEIRNRFRFADVGNDRYNIFRRHRKRCGLFRLQRRVCLCC